IQIEIFSDEESAILVIKNEEFSLSYKSEITPVNLMNFFLITFIELENNMNKNVKSNTSLEEMKDKKLKRKTDLKLSYSKLALKSYDKLKEILNIAGHNTPKLDGIGFL
ncbi:11273_t:CDS:2, partial [Funneliformis caledonium]